MEGYGVYKEAQAREFDQAKLILMMYAGAVNFLDKSIEAAKTDKVKMGIFVSKAKDVILELMASLNIDEGGEMGDMLLKTYRVLFVQLNIAHMQDNTEKIKEIRDSLSEIENTWKQVFSSNEYRELKKNRERFKLQYCSQER